MLSISGFNSVLLICCCFGKRSYSLSHKTVNTRENFWNVHRFATNQMRDETAKDNRQTAALMSRVLTRNKEMVSSSTRSLEFCRFQIVKFFFLDFGFGRIDMNDILRKKDVKSVDQTQLDSASENMKKMSQSQAMFLYVFFSRAVQKVMLLGCDWWFSIRIFL